MTALPEHLNLVDGRPCPAADARTIEVVDPSDGQPFATLPRSGAPDVDAAVRAARATFDGAWGRMTATERGRVLARLSALITQQAESLAQLECRDTGKPIQQARC